MVETYDAFVIGAGPAGLTTAYSLAKAGRSVHVIEQDPVYVGGISRTVDYKGFLFDIGGHRFFSKSKEVVDLWNEILPDDFIDRPRLSRIFYKGKFYAYPLRAFEALRNLGLLESVACVASYGWARLFPIAEPRPSTMGPQPVRRAALLHLLQDLHREGVGHGLRRDLRRLGGAAHQGPEPRRRRHRRLRRSLGLQAARRASGAKTLIESFRYPRRGPGMMWEAAAAKIQALGGTSTWARASTRSPATRRGALDRSRARRTAQRGPSRRATSSPPRRSAS